MRKVISFFMIGIVLVVSGSMADGASKDRPGKAAVAQKNSLPRLLRWSFTVRNSASRVIEKSAFLTYIPVSESSSSEPRDIKASYPYELFRDEKGNRILRFDFKDFSPYGAKIISLEAVIAARSEMSPVNLKDAGVCLKAEEFIESDNAGIVRLAKELRGKDGLKTAENIFRWVADNIKYEGYTEQPRGALYALEQKRGDCTEMAYLFAALCRANGIAARVCGGYICPGNKVLKPSDYHDWAEFYMDKKWRVADPQKNVFMPAQSDYVAMKIMGESVKNPINRYHRFYSEPVEIQSVMNY